LIITLQKNNKIFKSKIKIIKKIMQINVVGAINKKADSLYNITLITFDN
jgi:hypothetical protein